MNNKKEYIEKIKREIQRSKDENKKILWADFTLSKDEKNAIVLEFENDYDVDVLSCHSCKGYDVYIQEK